MVVVLGASVCVKIARTRILYSTRNIVLRGGHSSLAFTVFTELWKKKERNM